MFWVTPPAFSKSDYALRLGITLDWTDHDEVQVHGVASDYDIDYVSGDSLIKLASNNDLIAVVKHAIVISSDLISASSQWT